MENENHKTLTDHGVLYSLDRISMFYEASVDEDMSLLYNLLDKYFPMEEYEVLGTYGSRETDGYEYTIQKKEIHTDYKMPYDAIPLEDLQPLLACKDIRLDYVSQLPKSEENISSFIGYFFQKEDFNVTTSSRKNSDGEFVFSYGVEKTKKMSKVM